MTAHIGEYGQQNLVGLIRGLAQRHPDRCSSPSRHYGVQRSTYLIPLPCLLCPDPDNDLQKGGPRMVHMTHQPQSGRVTGEVPEERGGEHARPARYVLARANVNPNPGTLDAVRLF